ELTKRHEEVLRGSLPELADRIRSREAVRGEVTVLIAARGGDADAADATDGTIEERLRRLLAAGVSVRDASTAVAGETGRGRREVYQRALALARSLRA
ncbi:MAG TPA: 16S rRNA (cytidine(1402)-2'-O)-methyltransferase, partial [Candidatus Limnocylindria bacterium]|nr:16S rRNA (cytidine(1402)-2'-O)-methyltransferase [Candidatus Limnocylindria bacterium]